MKVKLYPPSENNDTQTITLPTFIPTVNDRIFALTSWGIKNNMTKRNIVYIEGGGNKLLKYAK
eukprot:scaffold98084_cov36-Attheya_sp.AAC.2